MTGKFKPIFQPDRLGRTGGRKMSPLPRRDITIDKNEKSFDVYKSRRHQFHNKR